MYEYFKVRDTDGSVLHLCTFKDTPQKGDSRDCTRLKKMAVRYLEQKIRDKNFSPRERQLEKPASAAAAKGKSKSKGKRRKVNALEEKSVE